MATQYGYVRCSTDAQVTDLQRDALVRAGVGPAHIVLDEGVSGAVPARDRPGFSLLMEHMDRGDTLCVWKLDRLGRSTLDLLGVLDELRVRGVGFRSLTESIDTTTPAGQMMCTMLAAFAQFERDLLKERISAGMDAARARGVHVGRPVRLDARGRALAKRLVGEGEPASSVARTLGCSVDTVRRACKSGAA